MGDLLQLHWQFDDRTEMRSQFSPSEALHGNPDGIIEDEVRKWIKDVQGRHPLPEGAQWMMCNEKSKDFVWAVEPAKT